MAKPNATHQVRLEAEARHERRLLGVRLQAIVRPCTGAWGARETVPGTFCSQALQDGAPATEADTAAGVQQ